jgi:hypothetical protein
MSWWWRVRTEVAGAWRSLRYDVDRVRAGRVKASRRMAALAAFGVLAVVGAVGCYVTVVHGLGPLLAEESSVGEPFPQFTAVPTMPVPSTHLGAAPAKKAPGHPRSTTARPDRPRVHRATPRPPESPPPPKRFAAPHTKKPTAKKAFARTPSAVTPSASTPPTGTPSASTPPAGTPSASAPSAVTPSASAPSATPTARPAASRSGVPTPNASASPSPSPSPSPQPPTIRVSSDDVADETPESPAPIPGWLNPLLSGHPGPFTRPGAGIRHLGGVPVRSKL